MFKLKKQLADVTKQSLQDQRYLTSANKTKKPPTEQEIKVEKDAEIDKLRLSLKKLEVQKEELLIENDRLRH